MMSAGIDKEANCHSYCRYDRCCTADGEKGRSPWMCPNAWRIEEIMADYPQETEDEEEYE